MQINFSSPYKSIKSFSAIDLPDFVVLTGVNGAGKSHFLQALESGALRIEGIPHNPQTRNIRRFEWSNLGPNDTGAFAGYQAKQERGQMWAQLSMQIAQSLPQLQQVIAAYPSLTRLSAREFINLDEDKIRELGIPSENAANLLQSISATANALSQNIIQQFSQNDPNKIRLMANMQATANLPLIAFEENDFYESLPPTWQPVDMFQQSFARLFSEYQTNKTRNKFKQWRISQGENLRALTDPQFTEKYGTAPWEFVNSILEAAAIDFRINEPSEDDERPYDPTLTDLQTDAKVKFNDLSSGERVLMSFALCLYYANDKRQIVEYPQILLFDEIDAPLHPSMTESLLRAIENVLVAQHNIKVIMTTHSPATVALAPENSLYAMRKDTAQRMTKTTKDSALSILMTGVPTLSMSYENRRQVFVESHHDVGFYESLYEKLKPRLTREISLNFIASSGSKIGGCAHVKDVVNQLYGAGNKTVFGIIDWDTSNVSRERVRVLGQGQRYSIENYIFDPILVAVLLFLERIISRADIGLADNETHAEFAKLDNARLQQAADFVVTRLATCTSQTEPSERVVCQYVGGNEIQVPKWLLQMQGHSLEDLLKETFPKLRGFHGEAELKKAVLSRVIDDLPSLTPLCILNLFIEIQSM